MIDILALLGLVCFLSILIAAGIAWFTYRFYQRLPKKTKYLVLAGLIIAGAFLLEVGIGDVLWILAALFWIRDHLGR